MIHIGGLKNKSRLAQNNTVEPIKQITCYRRVRDGLVVFPGYNFAIDEKHGKAFIYGVGWKKIRKNEFETFQVPELGIKPLPWFAETKDSPAQERLRAKYRKYAAKYGNVIAEAQLYCSEISKPMWHDGIMRPAENRPTRQQMITFQDRFGFSLTRFCKGSNPYQFDLLKFERWLEDEHGSQGSIAMRVKKHYGKRAHDLIDKLIRL